MAGTDNKNISAHIEPELAQQFDEQCDLRGFVKRRAVQGMVRQWLQTPRKRQIAWVEGSCEFNDDLELRDHIVQILHELEILPQKLKQARRANAGKDGS